MLLLLLLGCPAQSPAKADSLPAYSDPEGATLEANAEGTLTYTTPEGAEHAIALGFGFVGEPNDGTNYNPWNLYDPNMSYGIPSGLEMAVASGCSAAADGYEMTLDNGEVVDVRVDEAGPGLRLTLQHDDATWAPYVFVRIGVASEEAFYGLGEIFSSVEHRGQIHPMQIELDAGSESAYNEVHVPVPLLISSAGWGVLADSTWPGVFDVGASDADTVEFVFNQRNGFSFDLYAPGSPAEVTARYHARKGAPEIPPTWAFAPLQWRNVVADQSVVLEDAAAIRALDLPTGVIWVDNPWQSSYNSMIPDPAMFPDWPGMMETLHAQGFRVLAWTTPYIEEDDPEHSKFQANGWFPDFPILFSDFGDIVDLTHPDAAAAWAARVGAARDLGIEGWKLDYGEDVQLGVGAGRNAWAFANGQDERTMHHQFATYFHQPYSDPYDGDGVLIGRAGVLGGHTVTDVIWPGDLDNDFQDFGDEGCDELRCVGGLSSAIRGGTGLAASGYPFFASDTGGYRGGRPGKESFIRWMEYASILPIWQYGGAGENHNPWDFTEYESSQFDEEVLASFRRYASLHIRLFPYYWMYAERLAAEGLPIVQAQGFAYPEDRVRSENSFLVGEDLFVAPVEEKGETSRAITLPSGSWVHWWTGEEYASGEATISAPLGAGPLFIRQGAAIPMLRRSVVTLSPADTSVDSWASVPGVLNARLVPGEDGGFTLSTGESVAMHEETATLTDGSMYEGWDVEFYLPGARGGTADGEDLPLGEDGCGNCIILGDPWIRVVVPAGTGSITVE